MTRAMCSRTSKRKHTKPSQEIIENCKENSPLITSQSKAVNKKASNKKQVKVQSSVLTSKENVLTSNTKQVKVKSSVLTSKENELVDNSFLKLGSSNNNALRKSERNCKSSLNIKDYVYDVPKGEIKSDSSFKRNVLGDKTNSPLAVGSKISTQNQSSRSTLEKNNDSTKLKSNKLNESCIDKNISKPHVPVYKTIDHSETLGTTSKIPLEKKEAVYEFDEVDENEEPVKKKKKKRVNTRKPKTGPKALRINNIKYSSTESLVSLPEKPVRQKKPKHKMVAQSIKPYSSVNNLNDSDDTSYTVKSFMSHPPSLLLCNKRECNNQRELSVLQETQSEFCQSPVRGQFNSLNNVKNLAEKSVVNPQSNVSIVSPVSNKSLVPQNNSAVPQQRCYPSKRSHLEHTNTNLAISQHCSINDTLSNQITHCSANFSTSSSHDFLSSTPCKQRSSVVCHNSVFSDSYDKDIPINLRPSTGFIKEASESIVTDDKFFGFDEPEELEEPLVSPIKNINLREPRILPKPRPELSFHNDIENPKPDVKEVIEKLKATIPKPQTAKTSEVFNLDSSSSDHSIPSSPISKEVETTLSFIKPPRRSYERPRRIRHYSEPTSDSDSEKENQGDESQQRSKHNEKREQESVLKPTKKCYQKRSVLKAPKAPHVPIAKQRILKEEEELEKMAAQMNAKFQEIEKCSLVVE